MNWPTPIIGGVPDEIVRVRAVVRGRVQQVGFRAFVLDKAEDLGVHHGTVANRPDGSVECVLEAARPRVEALLERLRQGPSSARVERVDVEPLTVTGTLPPMRVTA